MEVKQMMNKVKLKRETGPLQPYNICSELQQNKNAENPDTGSI